MSLTLILVIGILGGIGSVARFLLDRTISLGTAGSFPFGTFTVNSIGAFLLGLVAALGLPPGPEVAIEAGALGGFTTFSTMMLESHRLAEDGQAGLGIANFTASLVLGIALVWAGGRIGGLL